MFRRLAIIAAIKLSGLATAASAQTLTVLRAGDAPNYDPQRVLPAVTSEVIFMLGDTLLAMDHDMKTVHPLLAKSWTVSPDGKVYTFKLRDDVTFCSGKKFTAEDAVYTFKRLIDPAKPKPSVKKAGKVKSLSAPDPYTFVYELDEPFNELPQLMTLFHATILNKKNVDALGDDFGIKGFDGTGPMCWESWTPRGDTVLVRHDGYRWGPEIYQNRGPSKLSKIVFRTVPEDQSRMAAMLTGQGDVTSFLPLASLPQVRSASSLMVSQAENYYRTCFFGLKVTRPLMAEKAVRAAMNLSVNRDEIAKSIFFGTAIPATTFIHPDATDFSQSSLGVITYDPEGAKKVLDEAGWKSGSDGLRTKDGVRLRPLAIILSSGPSGAMATALQGYLRRIGVDLEIQTLDPTIFFSRWAQQDYDIFALCNPYLSAGEVLRVYWPSSNRPVPNNMMWADAETDQWLDQGSSALDPAQRAKFNGQVQDKITREFLWIPVVHDNVYLTQSQKLKPIRPHAIFTSLLYKGLDIEFR